MPISKVVYGADTIIDITDTTATASDVLNNKYFYLSDGTKKQGTIAQGSEGVPVATKGTVSNHTVSITPSVTNTAGIITGGTKTGTAVSVSASELVSGTKNITGSGNTDVTNYATVSVPAGTATTPAKTIGTTPSISINANGLITASVAGSSSITPTVSSGWIANGTSGTVSVSGSNTKQLTVQAAATITPTESEQTAVASGRYTTGIVKVGAISSTYVGSAIKQRSSADLTASGSTITAPSGYYASAATKTVSAGAAGTPVATKGTVSNNSIAITPSVTNTTGYIVGGTKTGTAVTVSANELVNGTKNITASGSTNVTNYAYASVAAGAASTPATTINVTPTINVGANGQINVSVSGNKSVTPTVTTGYITTGTAGTITVSGSSSQALSTQGAATIAPTESQQVAVASGKYTTGIVKVGAIPSDYIGSAIASVSINQGITTVSGTTATRGIATWSGGVISSGQMDAASFANSSSGGVSYVDISPTTEAPVLVSGGYLYINKGYTDNLKISLAKLVPDGASADLASGVILSGYAAYNNDGVLIAGSIPTKSSNNVTVAGPTVSIPSGYYATAVSKSVQNGSATTPAKTITANPTVTFNTSTGVFSASVAGSSSVTPIVSAGYVTAGTAGTISVNGSSSYGLAVKSAADVTASGSKTTTPSGYYPTSVTKNIAAGAVSVPAKTISTVPSISVNNAGLVSVSVAGSSSVKPTVTAGYVSTGTAGTISVTGSSSYSLATQAGKTVNPTESEQTAVAAGKYTTGAIKVGAISSTYVGSAIAQRSSADLTASGSTITAPSGYYAAAATKSIATGTATTPTKTIGVNPTFSINSSTGVISASVAGSSSITPTITAGYISSGTAGTVSVSGSSNYSLSTQAAKTVSPTESVQTAVASGKYTTGEIKVGAISSTYIGSAIVQRSATDLTASGSTVIVPSGYYAAKATKNISAGSATTPPKTITAKPTFSINSSTGVITASVAGSSSITPTVSAGYVTAGTAGTVSVSGSSNYSLATRAATSYTPSASTQTIPSGVYLTGAQTIQPIPIGVDNHRLILPEGLIGV